jgi:hypothetical protein
MFEQTTPLFWLGMSVAFLFVVRVVFDLFCGGD